MSPPRLKALVGLVLASLLAPGCEPPPVVPTADRRQNQQTSRIEGEVVVQSKARGNAVILLYDAAHPPPPQGAGRPVSFTVIPEKLLFGEAEAASPSTSSGPFTAPFSFSLVAEGSYLLRGFIDTSHCHPVLPGCRGPDFIPWYNVTSEPNVGDVGGAAVDALTREPRLVEVAVGQNGLLQPATGITVSFSDSSPVPVDRPVFQVVGLSRLDPSPTATRQLELQLMPIQQERVNLVPAAFFVRYADANNDGLPEDANGDKQLDLWPRLLVRKLAEGPELTPVQRLSDENDLDRNGLLDDTGAEYPRSDGTSDGLPDQVILGATLMLDTPVMDALRNADGSPKMTAIVPVPSLRLVVQSKAYDARDPLHPIALRAVPSGRYALTVVQYTGQTWRVPNELAPGVAETVGLPPVATQSFVLEVP